MKDLSAVEDKETLKYVIRHELKCFGIKVPKEKRSSVRCTHHGKERSTCKTSVFGCPLDETPTVLINANPGSAVPKFLVDCVQFLVDNIDCEGLFRKPGSRTRQKELQRIIENDSPIPSDAHIHDVAGLFKLFFRELPEPLISTKLTEALIKCRQLNDFQELRYTTTLLCLTLPPLHLYTLRYTLQFLKQVAASVKTNRMDASNLALVMMPNLVAGFKADKSGNTAATEKLLRLQTAVVRHLIENAEDIGTVPDTVIERVDNFGNRSSDLLTDRLTSEDELEKSGELVLDERKKNRRRRRSGLIPIQGLMSGIGKNLGIRKSGAGSAVVKTPVVEEVIENPSFLGETPRILRSSKRKASEDLGAFSAVKRKAMLHQMTVDPQYSKPGLSLHRDGRWGLTMTDSPITPIRPNGPALGEIDAVTEDGETVFKFQTPSIKFADETFTTFCATPPGKADMLGTTPGKKHGRLNPLGSKKYKRRSGAMQTDISTPKSVYTGHKSGSVYESIKKKLGHRHTRTQPTPICLNDMPDKSVGWRLANPPEQEGSTVSDILAFGTSPHVKRTPRIRRKQRRQKMPSSPATLFSPRVALSQGEHDQMGKGQRSSVHTKGQESGIGVGAGADSDSPRVVVVKLKSSDMYAETSYGSVSNNQVPRECMQNSNSGGFRDELLNTDISAKGVSNFDSEILKDEDEKVQFAMVQARDRESARPELNEDSPSCVSLKHKACFETTEECQSLEHAISQKSLSSVLSQVSVDSTKSVFSVEIDYEMAGSKTAGSKTPTEDTNDVTVQNDNTLISDTARIETEFDFQLYRRSATTSEDNDHGVPSNNNYYNFDDNDDIDGVQNTKECLAQVGSMLSSLITDAADADHGYTGSVDSLESVNADEKHQAVGRRLVKSVSVDSGKGMSLDNLASFDDGKLDEAVKNRIASEMGIKTVQGIPHGLVKMMSGKLSPVDDASEESTCSISSEDNPHFRETKAFWKLAKTGHIFNKSLSDSQVNSPARKVDQALSPPVRSYHSQMHIGRKNRLEGTARRHGDTSLNSSMVKSNIDMFNSMCLQTTPVRHLRSNTVHHSSFRGVQKTAHTSSQVVGLNVKGETSKHKPARVLKKTHLTKSVSIDSGMSKLGGGLDYPETNPFTATSSRDHEDSYEMSLFKGTMIEIPKGLQETMDDICTPKLTFCQNAFEYENAEEMPVHDGDQELDQIPDHLVPVHTLHNESLTPLKLASSTIIRTPGKRSVKIKHRSPLKRLQILTTDNTPTLRETRSHKKYPCSPKNPLFRQQPCMRQQRSLIPNHMRDEMDVVEL